MTISLNKNLAKKHHKVVKKVAFLNFFLIAGTIYGKIILLLFVKASAASMYENMK